MQCTPVTIWTWTPPLLPLSLPHSPSLMINKHLRAPDIRRNICWATRQSWPGLLKVQQCKMMLVVVAVVVRLVPSVWSQAPLGAILSRGLSGSKTVSCNSTVSRSRCARPSLTTVPVSAHQRSGATPEVRHARKVSRSLLGKSFQVKSHHWNWKSASFISAAHLDYLSREKWRSLTRKNWVAVSRLSVNSEIRDINEVNIEILKHPANITDHSGLRTCYKAG